MGGGGSGGTSGLFGPKMICHWQMCLTCGRGGGRAALSVLQQHSSVERSACTARGPGRGGRGGPPLCVLERSTIYINTCMCTILCIPTIQYVHYAPCCSLRYMPGASCVPMEICVRYFVYPQYNTSNMHLVVRYGICLVLRMSLWKYRLLIISKCFRGKSLKHVR